MKKYESAYGIAGFLICRQLLSKLIETRTITRENAITLVQNASNYRENFKAMPFDEELLSYVDESLKLVKDVFLPLETDQGKP